MLLGYAALLLIMIPSQTDLLFPVDAVPAAGPMPPKAQRLQLDTSDGEVIHGIHLEPLRASQGPQTLILGFGGNGWNGQDVAEYLRQVFPEAHVVAFHYRGYAPSTGEPGADALIADAPRIFDDSVSRVRPDRAVAVGFSIGSGVAASLSRQRALDGAILVTPFDSMKAVAQQLYPWLPVGLFFEHEFPAAADLSEGQTPVAIIAAERDEIIPASRTDALRKAVPDLKFDRTIADAGHNDIYQRSDFQAALRDALAAVTEQ